MFSVLSHMAKPTLSAPCDRRAVADRAGSVLWKSTSHDPFPKRRMCDLMQLEGKESSQVDANVCEKC